MNDVAVSPPMTDAASNTSASEAPAVSWGAILAGAAVAAATSLILVLAATGIDLAGMSPWPGRGASATSLTVFTAIALLIIQWLSAAFGGYITGRLRSRWIGVHTHEVFFRDTANGLIAWAVATLLVSSALAAGASSLFGAGARASAMTTAAVVSRGGGAGSVVDPYETERLFRSTDNNVRPNAEAVREQAGPILAQAAMLKDVSTDDQAYLAQLVSAQTGVSADEAQRRVTEGLTQIKSAADSARRSAEGTAIFTALAMVIGAFVACVAAALGGRTRDLHP